MNPRHPSFLQFIPAITWFLLVLVLLCLPGKDLPEAGWLDLLHFDKLVHAALFGILLLAFAWPYRRSALPLPFRQQLLLRLLMATIVWGLATEFIQLFFIPGRAFDLADWLADALGALLAYALFRKKLLPATP